MLPLPFIRSVARTLAEIRKFKGVQEAIASVLVLCQLQLTIVDMYPQYNENNIKL